MFHILEGRLTGVNVNYLWFIGLPRAWFIWGGKEKKIWSSITLICGKASNLRWRICEWAQWPNLGFFLETHAYKFFSLFFFPVTWNPKIWIKNIKNFIIRIEYAVYWLLDRVCYYYTKPIFLNRRRIKQHKSTKRRLRQGVSMVWQARIHAHVPSKRSKSSRSVSSQGLILVKVRFCNTYGMFGKYYIRL